MKIDEVLESLNKALDDIRERKQLNVKGHFVALPSIKKSMGPYKEYRIRINYVNGVDNEVHLFCTNTCMERCNAGEEDKLANQCETEVLRKFFICLHKYYDSIIIGDYGCE